MIHNIQTADAITMSAQDVQTALSALNQPTTLSILTLSTPIITTTINTPSTRTSNVSSNDGGDTSLSPSALRTDLAHYKDLFSKLRFSYVEQVTKERFLKAISAATLPTISPSDISTLESQLAVEKAALNAKKDEVHSLIAALESTARTLARRYEIVQLQTTQLEALPPQIEGLDELIATLRQEAADRQKKGSRDPEMNLSLVETTALVKSREDELADLDARIEELRVVVPEKKRKVRDAERELGPLEERKRMAIDEAREAQRKRGKGGDEIEKRGRWLRAQESVLRSMLEV